MNYAHTLIRLVLGENVELLQKMLAKNTQTYFVRANENCSRSIHECCMISDTVKRGISTIGYHTRPVWMQKTLSFFCNHVTLFTLAVFVNSPIIVHLLLQRGVQPVLDDLYTAIAMLKPDCVDSLLIYFGSSIINEGRSQHAPNMGTPFTYLMYKYGYFCSNWYENDQREMNMIFHLIRSHNADILSLIGRRHAVTYLLLGWQEYRLNIGQTPCKKFHMQTLFQDLDTVKLNLNKRDKSGKYPIDYFLQSTFLNEEVILLLIDYNFDLHTRSYSSKYLY